nr:MAG TPA: hypothetical protein [Caudoviricetes sp.]
MLKYAREKTKIGAVGIGTAARRQVKPQTEEGL